MTKAVKVFRGVVASASATTIYTVPAGRVAKVTFSILRSCINGSDAGLSAGGITLYQQNASSSGCGFPVVYSQVTTNESMLLPNSSLLGGIFDIGKDFVCYLSWSLRSIPKEVYLVAGDTVSVTNASYSFSVIEEY